MDMYCTLCGQHVGEDFFGQLIHDYQDRDEHTPEVTLENA
jgi:hypothetical protein